MRGGASTYIVTRVHGLRTHLMPPRDIKTLARAKSLRDVSDSLMKTEYGNDISQLPMQEQDATTLELIFLRKLVQRFLFLRRAAQGKMKRLLTSYCARFEVENIKRIIRAKHSQGLEEPNLIPLPREYTLVNFPALLKAKDVEEVTSLLRDTPYHHVLANLQQYKERGTTLILEAGLDRIYYGRVWQLNVRVKGMMELIGEEIDLKNLMTVLSFKSREIPYHLIEEAIIPMSYALPKTTLQSLLKGSLEDAPNLLSGRYSRLASEAANMLRSESPLPLEWPFFKQLYGDASSILSTRSLEPGYVVAYLLLCECEAKNLVSIVTGKQLNLSEEEILKGLFGV